MLAEIMHFTLYGAIFLSLFFVDYALGNGMVDIIEKLLCKVACFIKKSIREEAKQVAAREEFESPVSLPMLMVEIVLLSLTIAFLKKYKKFRGNDRIDELLQESRETLRQTNEFLEKWRMRRINWQVSAEDTYLDEEPQEIKPLKLEVPILHMAIIDARGKTRSLPERGDAGDSITCTDSALLSVTSLLDEDFDVIGERPSDERFFEDRKTLEQKNRYLWDVMEED